MICGKPIKKLDINIFPWWHGTFLCYLNPSIHNKERKRQENQKEIRVGATVTHLCPEIHFLFCRLLNDASIYSTSTNFLTEQKKYKVINIAWEETRTNMKLVLVFLVNHTHRHTPPSIISTWTRTSVTPLPIHAISESKKRDGDGQNHKWEMYLVIHESLYQFHSLKRAK